MNAPEQSQARNAHRSANRHGESGDGYRARSSLMARKLHTLLDRMDAGILTGSVEGNLPDGSYRILGSQGAGPQAKMNIRSWRALARIAWSGSVGLYEGWEKGEWDSPEPVKIFELFVCNRLSLGDAARPSALMRQVGRARGWWRRNSKAGSRRNIEFHYDLGNDFYSAWLDESMAYSGALFEEPILPGESLAGAQLRKNDTLLERLNLKAGDSLLEIGCGWGGLAEAALNRCDISYHGITLSREQKAFADKRLETADKASVSITDYRDVSGQYDAIASAEMVEAVGQDYWPAYLDCIHRNLKPGGRAAIQYIRIEDDIFDAYASGVDFIQRYIFPGGMLLSESRFRKLAEDRGLEWQDQFDFGMHYAETLRRWLVGFDAAVAEKRLPQGFDKNFIRLWRFYLMYCEGGFRGGGINVTQVTLIKS